ncbi:MAG: endolytic transglycosylase MltG [bacterium]|nr:endolytic transglycosylase MltG [bacterium]
MLRILGRLVAALVVLVVLAVAGFAYLTYGDRSHPAQPTHVIVPRGSTFADISSQLAQAGVIESALAFRALARLRHADADVHAGAYLFSAHRSADEVLRSLQSGGAQVATWVTIPEGFTAEQIARRLQDDGLGDAAAFERVVRTSTLAVDGARTASLEGFLFPSTYLVPLDASPAQIAREFTDQFYKELPPDASARAKALHVSVPQAVIVASLVESEAKADVDRPLIASVIYNRLRLHMPLQIDATIEYALPEHKTELSFADLKIDSPYNTYLHEGLPPTPISNPGEPSLEAAFHPATTKALYYVYCGNGRHVFADTLAQHQSNVARCLH